jgi:hypothetical protein
MALERGDGPSLREGIEWHSSAMRARRAAPRSLATLLEEQERHLGDWLDRPLASLSRHEVATRHEDLTLSSGPWLANRVMQQLRAVYNTAARRCETLSPTNPTLAVTFNRLRRRREPIPALGFERTQAAPRRGQPAPRPHPRPPPAPAAGRRVGRRLRPGRRLRAREPEGADP